MVEAPEEVLHLDILGHRHDPLPVQLTHPLRRYFVIDVLTRQDIVREFLGDVLAVNVSLVLDVPVAAPVVRRSAAVAVGVVVVVGVAVVASNPVNRFLLEQFMHVK